MIFYMNSIKMLIIAEKNFYIPQNYTKSQDKIQMINEK